MGKKIYNILKKKRSVRFVNVPRLSNNCNKKLYIKKLNEVLSINRNIDIFWFNNYTKRCNIFN